MKLYHATIASTILFCAPLGCYVGSGNCTTTGDHANDAGQALSVEPPQGCVDATGNHMAGDIAAACGGNGNACTVCGDGADCRAGFCCDITACPDSLCLGKSPGDACGNGHVCGPDGSCLAVTTKSSVPCAGQPVGTICGGNASDGIHGECNANETCEWTEWTCIHGKAGDVCQGGVCVAKPGSVGFCCSWGCIDASGACVDSGYAWGGALCSDRAPN